MTTPSAGQFEDGSLVRLRSGGPTMVTVVDPNAGTSSVPITHCCWLDAHLHFQWRRIPTAALEPATAARGPGDMPIARPAPAAWNPLS